MNKNVLLISQGSTFMVDAICKNLTTAGFDVLRSGPVIKELKGLVEDADIIIFYLGDYILEVTEALIYLKDTCIEKEKSLNVIGDEEEVEALSKVIGKSVIENIFARPLDIKVLVAKLIELSQNQDSINARRNILLVDDDPTFLHLVKSWLSEKYKVTIVNSGMQAITYIAKNIPDLVLLDYEMPVTTGPQVLEMMRSEAGTSDIPVIFLTGKGDKESVAKVLKFKPQGYILKSAGQKEVTQQVDDFFERSKSKKI